MHGFEKGDDVILTDEAGVDIEMSVAALLEYEGAEYVALLDETVNPDDEEIDVVILRFAAEETGYPLDEGEEWLEEVEDSELLSAVFEHFLADLEDE
ncbi:hypothetical protein FACS1894208_02270 [Clostridia bacterium]|nr:hypothetical protein FACS1894208_02270 [Clostridia bacterium]